jgi:hypothetical protein
MRGQHYLVPFPPKAQIAARGVDLDHEYSDAKEARSKFELTVALGLEQSVNLRAAVGYKSWLGSNMFKFTDVNEASFIASEGVAKALPRNGKRIGRRTRPSSTRTAHYER